MEELGANLNAARTHLSEVLKQLKHKSSLEELHAMRNKSEQPDFWNNPTAAQQHMQRLSKLESRVLPWRELDEKLSELIELASLQDPSLQNELLQQYESWQRDFDEQRKVLKFSGRFDDHDVIMSIHAGAGGTDAQDWAAMLMRMYGRYFEKVSWKYTIIEESAGEEAGLKSATFEVTGNFAYGKLKGEHGVHRLVRLSPFNADNLRQTSFAKVEVMPKIDRPDDLAVDEKDLKIDVYRSGGHGGQSVNTTDSAVRITHLPTGVVVAIQNERSQLQNRETAMTILRSRLLQLQMEQHKERLDEIKGPNQSAEWGNQIRSYVLHPYKQVKDLRTRHETSDVEGVLNGDLDGLIDAYLEYVLGQVD